MISIVNYGMGNIHSVQNAIRHLGYDCDVIDSPSKIVKSSKLILPGVGAFNTAMENIRKFGFIEPLQEVYAKGVPILGICLGMQLLTTAGDEGGVVQGLGWIPGKVKPLNSKAYGLKTPHIGFSRTCFNDQILFEGLGKETDFYFVHSYHVVCNDVENIIAYANYGEKFAAAIQKGRVWGTQFHPEKSQGNGLTVLQNFISRI